MLVSELIKELIERLEMYGDLPVMVHYESDFTPYDVIDVSADFDYDATEPDYIEIIIQDESPIEECP